MARRPRPAVAWDLVCESFAEASFLWSRWEDALDSPQHTLDDVSNSVEDRLLGALEGVELGGLRAVEELLHPGLRHKRVRRATVAAYLLASAGRDSAQLVADAFAAAPNRRRLLALRRGLECARGSHGVLALCEVLPRLEPAAQAEALNVLAFRRVAPPPGVDTGLDRQNAEVQRRSIRLAASACSGRGDAYIEWGLRRSDPVLQVEATRAGMLRGRRGAAERAYALAAQRWAGTDALLPLCGLAHGNRALPIVSARADDGESTREAFDALAAIGTPEAAEVCARALDNPDQSRLAADALGTITGIRPAIEPGDPYDEDVPRNQLLLVAPSVDRTRALWTRARAGYRSGQRYFEGRPFSQDQLGLALATSSMRRRSLLARELLLRTQSAHHVTTRTWTGVQRAELGSMRAR